MLITTMCILVLKNTDHRRTAWHCNDVGYVVQSLPWLWDLEFKREYPFDVRVDENGDKVLVLRKGK